jgi:hypothetical protein
MNPKSDLIHFICHGHSGPLDNYVSLKFTQSGDIEKLTFNGSIRQFTGENWKDLVDKIEKEVERRKNPTETALTIPNKMNMGQTIKYLLSGGIGILPMMERLENIKKIAEGNMTETEKKASDSLLKNLKQLVNDGKPESNSSRNIG